MEGEALWLEALEWVTGLLLITRTRIGRRATASMKCRALHIRLILPSAGRRLSRFGSFMNLARYLRTGFLCIELHFALTRSLLSFILDTDVTFKH
jgi:hypothetical protein